MIKFLSSVLFVRDITTSCRFYVDLLEQEVDIDFGVNIGFKSGFAIWQVEHAHQTIFEAPTADQTAMGRRNFELYFEADDVDTVWAKASSANAQVVHPIREQPWGQRVFRIYDPDGHIVEVGEPMSAVITRFLGQGMPVEEIASRTGMPREIVMQFVQAG